MNDFLSHTPALQNRMHESILSHSKSFATVSSWGTDVVDRFASFAKRGKMVRGNAVVTGFLFCSGQNPAGAIDVGTAIELLHASLLIHDDIMDNDEKRRGEDSMFFQYQTLLKERGVENYKDLGKSLALCIGDIGFFLAYELLNNLPIEEEIKQQVIEKVSQELPFVGLGQMQDMIDVQKLSMETILQTYRYKTARYTFSLPFALGAILADKPDGVKSFEDFGEQLGILFQLKDDELGMFGTEKEIGKTVGSDIREGKKTVFYLYLLQNANTFERETLEKIWGNKTAGEKDFGFVYSLVEKYDIQEKIQQVIEKHLTRLEELLATLPIEGKDKKSLEEFISYNILRRK